MATTAFDEEALSSLTRRLNEKLSGAKVGAATNAQKIKQDKLPKKGAGRSRNPAGQNPPTRERSRQNEAKAPKAKQDGHAKPGRTAPQKAETKKRLRNGLLKSNDQKANKEHASADLPQDQLRMAVAELGGEDADLDLIKDAESGSELEDSPKKVEKKLTKELKTFAKELGIAGAVADAESSNSDGDDQPESHDEAEDELRNGQTASRKVALTNGNGPPSRMLFSPIAEWHAVELPPIPIPTSAIMLPHEAIDQLHRRGKDMLQRDSEVYATVHQASSSAHKFYSTIMASGTLTDRISALTLSVQESPIHNVRAFESLLGLAKKRSRAQSIEVLNAMKDLFAMGSLLPSTRHLRAFAAQPAFAAVPIKAMKNITASSKPPWPLTDLHLLAWAYEDWLKTKYFEVLQILETWLSDEILFSRLRATDMVSELLREKPEQEANLLRLLVNKLGDREKKVASKASFNILQLQIPHPSMASNIIRSIESDVLFRPGQNLHAKYYAMITLNQTVLSSKDEPTVREILGIYFAVFLSLLKEHHEDKVETFSSMNKKGERQGGGGRPGKMAKEKKQTEAQKGASAEDAVREKIMSAVLTGINRAIPFTDTSDKFFERHLDTLFRVTHSANFNTSVQSLMLIQQLCETNKSASDRFYRTLYESLLDPRLLTSSKQILYLNLLYRALRADINAKRIQAFAKRLLQCVAMHQPPFACGVIYLLRELEGIFPSLALLIDQPEEDLDEMVEPSHDASTQANGTGTAKNTAGRYSEGYDGKKRAPEHSHADRTCLWELDSFVQHFHPSVSMFANRLMTHDAMPPKPDLDSQTLTHFLDRFVYRNPKKMPDKLHGASMMQPLAASDSSGLLVTPADGRRKVPVNSDVFLKMRGENVKADEVFFHKYFNTKAQAQGFAKGKKEKRRKDAEDSEDNDEDEIWQALVDSRPEIEGSDDEVDAEMDLDMDDFSDLEGGSLSDMEDAEGSFDGEGVELNLDSEDESIAEDQFDNEDEGTARAESKKPEAKKRRQYLKSLPTFASAEDYAGMVDDDQGEELAP